MEEVGVTLPRRRTGRRKALLYGGGLMLVLILAVGGTLLWLQKNRPTVDVPESVSTNLSYTIYLPRQLPGTYTIDPDSFTRIEGDGVAFRANDNTETPIVFTEQRRPKTVNFSEFYLQNLKNGKVLDNMPYATFTGKTFDGKTNIVSIVTDDTWILATTAVPLTDEQIRKLGASFYPYKP